MRSKLLTGRRLPAVHPGEVLREEFIRPLKISRYRVAKAMGVAQRRVDELCAGRRKVTVDTAIRLERVFGLEALTWLTLQNSYDLATLSLAKKREIEREAKPLANVET